MMTTKNKSPQLLLAMTALVMLSTVSAEQSGFITSAQSNALNNQQTTTEATTATIKPSLTNSAPAALTKTTTLGYLGIGFDKVPASIRAHLPETVSVQQGLIVTRFSNTSSAAHAGMKVHDVLLTYDGQAIEKPENFINKIRQDKPGRIVTFTLVRQGQLLTLPVTMGAQAKKKPTAPRAQIQAGNPYQLPAQLQAPLARKTGPNGNFNGLAIRKIGNDLYDASIGFIGRDGKPQRRSYKGNRMQILQQIMQANDLPSQAKQQLLFAVQPRQQPKQSSSWGGMPNMPFGNNSGFNPNRLFNGWNW
jgi:hypothetical protein